MTINQASFYGDNLGSADTGHQYGPYELGSCSKLLHVTCGLTISTPGAALAGTALLVNTIIWGVQWVPHGDSPLALPGFAFDTQFLWALTLGTDLGISAAWAPNTDNGAVLTGNVVSHEWRGQLPINETIDLYLTTAVTNSDQSPFEGSFMMRVTNTT